MKVNPDPRTDKDSGEHKPQRYVSPTIEELGCIQDLTLEVSVIVE